MADLVTIGTVIGAACGACHAPVLYQQRLADSGGDATGALVAAAVAFGLWTLFGAYLLLFWLIGAAGMAVTSVLGGRARS